MRQTAVIAAFRAYAASEGELVLIHAAEFLGAALPALFARTDIDHVDDVDRVVCGCAEKTADQAFDGR